MIALIAILQSLVLVSCAVLIVRTSKKEAHNQITKDDIFSEEVSLEISRVLNDMKYLYLKERNYQLQTELTMLRQGRDISKYTTKEELIKSMETLRQEYVDNKELKYADTAKAVEACDLCIQLVRRRL